MAPGGWDRMAAWRDERSGETGDLWHRALIDPALVSVLGPVRGLRVLELACGNGYLARRLARAGAAQVVGVDSSVPTIARARSRERSHPSGARFEVGDVSRLSGFLDASFDRVVANMALMDVRDAASAIREAARVMAPDGRFVFSISHPCFDLDDRSYWVVERGIGPGGAFADTIWRKVRGYREEVRTLTPWQLSPTRVVRTKSYHRTLTTYSRLLREAGLAISRLEEPRPLPEMLRSSPQGPYIAEIPLHLVVEAVRGGPSRPASRTSGGSPSAADRRSGSPARTRGSGSSRRGSRTGS
jgi:SAM-dependent methyltransferase